MQFYNESFQVYVHTHRVCKVSVTQLPGRYLYSSWLQGKQLTCLMSSPQLDSSRENAQVSVVFKHTWQVQAQNANSRHLKWLEQVFYCQEVAASEGGGELSLNTVKGWCVSKPSVNHLNSYKRLLLPAHHCSLSPLLREQSLEISLQKTPATQDRTQQLLLSTNSRSSTTGSICRVQFVA